MEYFKLRRKYTGLFSRARNSSRKRIILRRTEYAVPSANPNRIFRYLQAIDDGNGRCSRMAFYNIAGNEENPSRWEKKLCLEWKLVSKIQDTDGRQYYVKTDLGEHLHNLLKNHEYIGNLFEELIRDRLRAGV